MKMLDTHVFVQMSTYSELLKVWPVSKTKHGKTEYLLTIFWQLFLPVDWCPCCQPTNSLL